MYCIDTDVLSAATKGNPPIALIRKFGTVPTSRQFTTAINLGEMLFGATKARRPGLAKEIRQMVKYMTVLPFDTDAAELYATLRADLETAGQTLHEADLRVASVALARNLIMVTGNVRHFERIPGLSVENWLAG